MSALPTDKTMLLVFGAVRFTDDRIEEFQDHRPIATVMLSEIRSVRIRHGFLAKHPLIQIIFGIAFAAVGFAMMILCLTMIQRGTVSHVFFFSPLSALLGLWIIYDAIKRGHYLEIWTDSGVRKLGTGLTLPAQEEAELRKAVDAVCDAK